MVRKRVYILSLLASLASLLTYLWVSPAPVWAGAERDSTNQTEIFSRKVTLGDLGYLKDETFQGIAVDRTYAINWPMAWTPQPGNTFTVNFSHSKALETYSSMAIDWNGTRLGSVLLTPQNAERASYEVKIPEDQIQPGYNELTLIFYMGIHEDRCEDPNNPATWATVHSDSFLELSYSLLSPPIDLGLYPAPLLDNSSLVENRVTFVVPDQPSLAELNALAVISAKLGQLAAWRNLSVEVLSESTLAEMSPVQGDILYVGSGDRLQALKRGGLGFVSLQDGRVTFVSNAGSPLSSEAGILAEQLSPVDPTAVEIFVTGSDEEALLIAARTLGSAIAYPRLEGPLGVVYEVPEPDPKETQFRQSIRFDELGYSDQTARGTRTQTINIIIPLQREWEVLTEARLDLHFAHSILLHPLRSALTVSINGSPVGSLLLTEENAEDSWASFSIPAQMFQVGDNKISITTAIDLIEDYIDPEECDEEYLVEAWVVVYADSQLNLPEGPAQSSLDLADYPFAFMGAPHLAELALVVPDEPGLAVAKAVVLIASRIGRSAEGGTLLPQVMGAQSASRLWKYQILIGKPLENLAIQALNAVLPLPFAEGSNTPTPVERVTRLLNLRGAQGFVEATLDEDKNPRLVVTGTSDEGLIWAANALHDPLLMRDLRGDLVILDSPDTLTAASIRQISAPVSAVAEGVEAQPVSKPTTWLRWVAGGFFLLALVILLILNAVEISRQRKARETYES